MFLLLHVSLFVIITAKQDNYLPANVVVITLFAHFNWLLINVSEIGNLRVSNHTVSPRSDAIR